MAAQKWKLRVQGAREKDMFVDNNGSAHKLFAPVSCRTERWTMVISEDDFKFCHMFCRCPA